MDPFPHIWNLVPRPLEGYKELRTALRVGASCSGKAKQERGSAQGRMTQANCSQPQGRELLFLLFFGFILPDFFKLLDLRLPGEIVSFREEAKLTPLLLLILAAQGFRAAEVLSVQSFHVQPGSAKAQAQGPVGSKEFT